MLIKSYEIYCLKINEFNHIDIDTIRNLEEYHYLNLFFLYAFRSIKHDLSSFIREIKNNPQDRFLFEDVEVNFEQKNNLIYLSEGWNEYHNKPTTPEIETLLEEENFIQLCKMGFLDYLVMTKDNFMHILLTWDNILKQLPPFALLYLNDQNWYDIKAFDSQETMEQFIADHTKHDTITLNERFNNDC